MKVDTIVVGQGIAGTMVAFMLHLHKVPFIVIDPALANTSSRIAAGMFTPISGKRKTVLPDTGEQISFAINIYKLLEKLLQTNLLHLNNIYHLYHSVLEKDELEKKSAVAGFAKYIAPDPSPLPGLQDEFGACEITHSGWVDCGLLMKAFSEWLYNNNALRKEEFIYNDLQFDAGGMHYHGIDCNSIIFCEGYQAVNNPFFKDENLVPCKGDTLTIEYSGLVSENIIKKNGTYLIPTGNKQYRAGATYHWHNSSTDLDNADRLLIERQLQGMLKNNFATVAHQTAIRPTTQNRKVIAKEHATHPGMFMLNGLGTKGVLQGPWWAWYIVQLCMGNKNPGNPSV